MNQQNMPQTEQEIGMAIFCYTWLFIRDCFHDRSKLGDWEAMKDRCAYVTDIASGIAQSRELIALLDDQYAELVVSVPDAKDQPVQALEQLPAAENAATQMPVEDSQISAWDLPQNIVYAAIKHFNSAWPAEELSRLIERMETADALILDFSFNLGGLLDIALDLLECLVESGLITITESRTPEGVCREEIWFSEREVRYLVRTAVGVTALKKRDRKRSSMLGKKPLAVIVNHMSASCSEVATTALQANCDLVATIGCTSASKGLVQTQIPYLNLPGQDITLHLTNGRWFTPEGDWIGDCGKTLKKGVPLTHVAVNDPPGVCMILAYDLLCARLGKARFRDLASSRNKVA